jgi:dsDNA-specific endonuclease/ATPase MutS2
MEKLFDILEFNKIKELILKYNINELSRKKVNELEPLFFDEVVSE